MNNWAKHPVIYEINAWVWLGELTRKYARTIDLASVPAQEWDAIAAGGFDAVWLMGVWQRSAAGIAIANRNAGLCDEFRRVLADYSNADNVGSPYCVRRYVVDAHLGGAPALASARSRLRERGLRLLLDFVPNHVAPDHRWISEHPEYLVQGSADEARADPESFVTLAGRVFACGRDPYFPAWPDVVQLNAFAPGLRQATIDTLADIAEQCDGVRCDMAMLMLNAVFARTWGGRVGSRPETDYWATIIPQIRRRYPGFRFIAEAYWGLEWELQQQGFDFCYDKTFYDRMVHGDAQGVRLHLLADASYQERMLRFIENHDEARAAATFAADKARAAALAMLTLGGAKLVHEGQAQGRRVRLPVFLARRPPEADDGELAAFYSRLLAASSQDVMRNGQWRLCECTGWADNPSCANVLAWCWELGNERRLVVVNDSAQPAQARVHLPWDDLRERVWRLDDLLSGAVYERNGDEMNDAGLYVDLAAWQYHFIALRPD